MDRVDAIQISGRCSDLRRGTTRCGAEASGAGSRPLDTPPCRGGSTPRRSRGWALPPRTPGSPAGRCCSPSRASAARMSLTGERGRAACRGTGPASASPPTAAPRRGHRLRRGRRMLAAGRCGGRRGRGWTRSRRWPRRTPGWLLRRAWGRATGQAGVQTPPQCRAPRLEFPRGYAPSWRFETTQNEELFDPR